jgi:hypothetical protein
MLPCRQQAEVWGLLRTEPRSPRDFGGGVPRPGCQDNRRLYEAALT